jgi:thiol-disulfide isomerase/thioredoxin
MTHRGLLRLSVFGALILAGIWGGVRLYGVTHRSTASVAVPAGVASAPGPSDLSPAEIAGPPIKIPDHMPTFALNDLSGHSRPISTWSGKPLVLNFWATWCAPCRREIPLLKTLAEESAIRDVTIIGIAVDYADKVQRFVDEFHIGYPVLVGEQDALDVAAQLGVESPAFPFTVFVDRKGDVVALFVGELHRPQADLIISVVQELDTRRIELPQARQKIASGLDALATRSMSG